MLDILKRVEERLVRVEGWILVFLVGLMLSLAVYNVLYRNVLVPIQAKLTIQESAPDAGGSVPPPAQNLKTESVEVSGDDEGFGGGFGDPVSDPPESPSEDEGFGGGFGDDLFSDFFRAIFGGMGGAGTASRANPAYQQQLDISLEEAYKGTTRQLQTDGKRKQVRIPPGVRTGSKVRVAGAGPNGMDLYLIVQVNEHPNFERKGNDLHTTAKVSVFTAILGGDAEVETMTGKVKLSIPPGTQPEQVFRVAGRGMPHLKSPNTKGDLFVRLKVEIPRYLSSKQRELLEEASKLKF